MSWQPVAVISMSVGESTVLAREGNGGLRLSRLVIFECEGIYVKRTKAYSESLVCLERVNNREALSNFSSFSR